jgi:hypothetical protein
MAALECILEIDLTGAVPGLMGPRRRKRQIPFRWISTLAYEVSARTFRAIRYGMLKKNVLGLGASLWLVLVPAASLAEDLFIYPTKNQTEKQQEQDKWECRAWATKQSGFDPVDRPTASTPPPGRQARRGGLVRGAAGGAAIGAVGGAIGGDAGKGAAIGAAAGGLLGVMRRNNQVREEQYAHQQWEQQNLAQHEANRSNWTRAVKACLTGRGYTVQ